MNSSYNMDTEIIAKENKQETVTLIVEGKQIKCCRSLLMKHSSYFNAMFTSKMQERNASEVTMHGVLYDGLKSIIEYISQDIISKNDEAVQINNLNYKHVDAILQTAAMLDFTEVQATCCSYLQQNIDPDNCLHVLALSDQHSLNSLYNYAKKYSLWNFSTVVACEGFLHAPLDVVIDYLGTDSLNAESEDEVLFAALAWLHDGNRESPCQEIGRTVLECVQFGHITKSAFTTVERTWSPKCKMCVDILWKKFEDALDNFTPRRHVPRSICFTGQYKEKTSGDAFVAWTFDFDSSERDIGPITNIQNVYVQGSNVCVLGIDLYVTGGEYTIGTGKWMNKVWRFSGLDHQWTEVSTLMQPRRHHGVAVYRDSLFLVGGFGRYRVMLDSMEEFDVSTGEWHVHDPLLQPTYEAAVTFCNNNIYVIKHEIQCFNVTIKSWTLINIPLPFEYGLANAIPHGNTIYLSGKFSTKLFAFHLDVNRVDEINIGRPDENVTTKFGAVCLSGNDLYIHFYDPVGGYDGISTSDIVSSIAKYNVLQKSSEVKTVEWNDVFISHAVCLPMYQDFR